MIGTGAMGGSAGIFHPSGISVEATPEIPWKTNADLPPRYIGIFPALKEKTAKKIPPAVKNIRPFLKAASPYWRLIAQFGTNSAVSKPANTAQVKSWPIWIY